MTDRPVLSKRLLAVYNAVPKCGTLVDVGTDHGYIPILSILDGKAVKAVAADIHKGPLSRAKENAERSGVCDKIAFELTDGLKGITAGPDDCIVISGFGGMEMISVLTDPGIIKCPLVLQPQRSAFELRRYLDSCGYTISNETSVKDRGRYYSVIECFYSGEKGRLSDLETYAGKWITSEDPDPDHIDDLIRITQKKIRSDPGLKDVYIQLLSMLNRRTEVT